MNLRDDVFEAAEGDQSEEWCPDEPSGWLESRRLDEENDRIREERHFGYGA